MHIENYILNTKKTSYISYTIMEHNPVHCRTILLLLPVIRHTQYLLHKLHNNRTQSSLKQNNMAITAIHQLACLSSQCASRSSSSSPNTGRRASPGPGSVSPTRNLAITALQPLPPTHGSHSTDDSQEKVNERMESYRVHFGMEMAFEPSPTGMADTDCVF